MRPSVEPQEGETVFLVGRESSLAPRPGRGGFLSEVPPPLDFASIWLQVFGDRERDLHRVRPDSELDSDQPARSPGAGSVPGACRTILIKCRQARLAAV